MNAVLVLMLLHAVPAAGAEPAPVEAAETSQSAAPATSATAASSRRIGVHLGLNATAAVDAELGDLFYGQFATQLTGLGSAIAPDRGLVLSAFVMGGVTLPISQGARHRLHFDAGPHVTLLRAAPVNMLAGGVVAGLRLVFANGITLGLKLPVIGYAGSLDQPRGSILQYYVAAVPTVPLLTVGYSF